MELNLTNTRQWTAVFVAALVALGILVSDDEYTRRKFEQFHIEQRGYEAQPSVATAMAASGTPTVAGFVITQGR